LTCSKDTTYPGESGQKLLEEEEFARFVKEEAKCLHWNNYFTESTFYGQKVEYRGYWSEDRKSI